GGGGELALVGQADADPGRGGDDVVVGEDEALGIGDEARPLAAARAVVVAAAGRARPRLSAGLGDGDVDDRGVDALDDVGEVRRTSRHRSRGGMDRVDNTAPGGEGAEQTRDTGYQ